MVLSIVQLYPSSLNVSQFVLICSVPVHICNDPWVFEVDESVVNKEVTSGGWVEDVKVSVLDPSTVEVGRRESPGMERSRVLLIPLVPHSYKVSIFANASVTNVLGGLSLSFLIEKDNGVEVGLSFIIPYPPFARVIRILKVASKGRSKMN